MRKFRVIAVVSIFVSTVSIAEEVEDYVPMTLQQYTEKLLDNNDPSILVLGAEIFGMSGGGETPFYDAIGAAITPYASAPVVTVKCRMPPIVSPWVGNYWYPWCKSSNTSFPTYEAQRDTYVSINGQAPVYTVSKFFDCQNALDRSVMPGAVKTAVC